MDTGSSSEAGWYPDPVQPDKERWWDGRGWLNQWREATIADEASLEDSSPESERSTEEAGTQSERSPSAVDLELGGRGLYRLYERKVAEGFAAYLEPGERVRR